MRHRHLIEPCRQPLELTRQLPVTVGNRLLDPRADALHGIRQHLELGRRNLRRRGLGCLDGRVDDPRSPEFRQRRPVLRERVCELESRDHTLSDQDLTQALAGLALDLVRRVDLVATDEPELQEGIPHRKMCPTSLDRLDAAEP